MFQSQVTQGTSTPSGLWRGEYCPKQDGRSQMLSSAKIFSSLSFALKFQQYNNFLDCVVDAKQTNKKVSRNHAN